MPFAAAGQPLGQLGQQATAGALCTCGITAGVHHRPFDLLHLSAGEVSQGLRVECQLTVSSYHLAGLIINEYAFIQIASSRITVPAPEEVQLPCRRKETTQALFLNGLLLCKPGLRGVNSPYIA